jgi:hypothetical protein
LLRGDMGPGEERAARACFGELLHLQEYAQIPLRAFLQPQPEDIEAGAVCQESLRAAVLRIRTHFQEEGLQAEADAIDAVPHASNAVKVLLSSSLDLDRAGADGDRLRLLIKNYLPEGPVRKEEWEEDADDALNRIAASFVPKAPVVVANSGPEEAWDHPAVHAVAWAQQQMQIQQEGWNYQQGVQLDGVTPGTGSQSTEYWTWPAAGQGGGGNAAATQESSVSSTEEPVAGPSWWNQ